MRKYISKFHYLTQDLTDKSHLQQVTTACQAGANWIQYRCLTKSDEELIKEMNELSVVCDDWGATLIVTEHYHLLDMADVQGVHIEDMNADLLEIRHRIGDERTLGVSANSIEDICSINQQGVADYIGCGPFVFTKTKINDYPLLGTEGYSAIIEQMRTENIDIPLIAVGGIKPDDVSLLLNTGIYGIAVSSAVNLAEDPEDMIKNFRRSFI